MNTIVDAVGYYGGDGRAAGVEIDYDGGDVMSCDAHHCAVDFHVDECSDQNDCCGDGGADYVNNNAVYGSYHDPYVQGVAVVVHGYNGTTFDFDGTTFDFDGTTFDFAWHSCFLVVDADSGHYRSSAVTGRRRSCQTRMRMIMALMMHYCLMLLLDGVYCWTPPWCACCYHHEQL